VSTDSWTQYAEYARRLDAVRAEEAARTAGMREGVAQMTTHADELEYRLNGQGGMLINLATTLRFRRPKLTPIAPELQPDPKKAGSKPGANKGLGAKGLGANEGPAPTDAEAKPAGVEPEKPAEIDPATGLSELAATIDRADKAARDAATRGEYPALLPRLTGTARNLVFYGVAALLVLGFQALAFSRTSTETNPFGVLFLFPLIGFALAYVALRVGGRTRVAQEALDVSPRLGFLLCFLIGPIAAAVVVATSFSSK
jgi:hypothetical protein